MPVLNIEGRRVTVDDSFLRLSPEEQNKAVDEIAASLEIRPKQEEEPTSFRDAQRRSATEDRGALTASTVGGAQGATLGFGDEIMAGAFTPLEMAIGAFSGEDEGKGFLDRAGDAYSRGLDLQRAQIDAARENHPVASFAGEMAGGAMTSGVGMGAAKTTLGRMAVGAGEGVAMGGVSGFGSGEGLEDRLDRAEFGAKVGAGAGAVLPAVGAAVGAAARGGRTFLEPFTAAGRDRIAARRIEDGATDPEALRRSLDEGAEELVPGSEPTTFQATGDMGLGAMERAAQTRNPARFNQRRTDQNAARAGALDSVQPDGAPEAVSSTLRQRLQQIDDETQSAIDAATRHAETMRRGVDERTGADLSSATRAAQDGAGAMGAGLTPDAAGDTMRGAIETARAKAKVQERVLWSAVDPDGTLALGTQNVRKQAQATLRDTPKSAKPPSGEEAAILDVVAGYKETMPFGELTALQSRLKAEMSAERFANGESPAYRRLSQLNASIQADLETAVAGKVAREADAVARGEMRQEDTAEAALLGFGKGDYAAQRSTTETAAAPVGREPGARAGADGVGGSGALPREAQAEGEERAGLFDPASNQGLSRDRSLDGARAEGTALASGQDGTDPRANAARDEREGAGFPDGPSGAQGGVGRDLYRSADGSGVPRLRSGSRGLQPGGLTLAEIQKAKFTDPIFVRAKDGQAFVGAQPGKPDLGTAPNVDGDGAEIPIRVRRGEMLKHAGNDVHQTDAEMLGYRDSWEMVQDVASDWREMRRGLNGRIQLVKPGESINGIAVVEIAKVDGSDYWRVVTAHRGRAEQLGKTIQVRERTPDAPSGNSASIVNSSPQGRQEAVFAQDRISPEDMPSAATGQGMTFDEKASSAKVQGWADSWRGERQGLDPNSVKGGPGSAVALNFDASALGRLNEARAVTKGRVETFDNKTLAPIRRRPGTTSPYDMPAGAVPSQIFKPGPKGFDAIETYRRAVGNDPEAMGAVRDYAVDRLQHIAGRPDGTLDPSKVKTWRRIHSDALRAFPDLDAQLQSAAGASEVVAAAERQRAVAMRDAARSTDAEVSAARGRDKALREANAGTLGTLANSEDPQEIAKLVGGVFSARDSAQQMLRLRNAIGKDETAQEGLRRAVIDHMTGRTVGNTEAGTSGIGTMKSDGFQSFVRQNRSTLRLAGFGDEDMDVMERIAADLQRANRSIASVKLPGQSNTTQDALAVGADDKPMTIFGKVAARLMSPGPAGTVGGVGYAAGTGSVGGGLALAAAGIGAEVIAAMRKNGLEKVEDIVADALLHPERARLLLSKATGKAESDTMARLVKIYSNAAAVTGGLEGGGGGEKAASDRAPASGVVPVPADRERATSPRLTPEDRASPIPSDLIDDGKAVMDGRPIKAPKPDGQGGERKGVASTDTLGEAQSRGGDRGPRVAPPEARERWGPFPRRSGTMGIPRSEMPQIKSEHRGAMVNFLAARGIKHEEVTVPADSLKPTQREFSRAKVEQAKDFSGGNRAILVSSDWQILDGHHQWLAKREAGEDVRVIRLDAPIRELLEVVKEFPSATLEDTHSKAPSKPKALQERAPAKAVEKRSQAA